MTSVIRVNPRDSVVVAVRDLEVGELVQADSEQIEIAEPIPFGHKMAVRTMACGDAVIKYGEVIGVLTADVTPGMHVHVHNLVSARLPGASAGANL
jgi:altronate hydrolase